MRKVAVTGGAGFLGRHLVLRLRGEGLPVRVLDLPSPALTELSASGAVTLAGDLRDPAAVRRLCADQEVVFHVAALAAPWGKREEFFGINVIGTDNVIEACRAAGVKRLVHVSSPSAIFDGKDHVNADESLPYPSRFLSLYSETKAVSEQHALAANGPDLEVAVIRPHAIWGPGDHHLFPRLARRAKAGKLFQVGDGNNLISTLFVENGVDALLLAAEAEAAPGNVYFITDAEPVKIWDFIRRALTLAGLPGPRGRVPYPVAAALASGYEKIWSLFRLQGEPPLTRYTVAEIAKTHTYSIARARKDLGYDPKIGVEAGLAQVEKWIQDNQSNLPW